VAADSVPVAGLAMGFLSALIFYLQGIGTLTPLQMWINPGRDARVYIYMCVCERERERLSECVGVEKIICWLLLVCVLV
jgi:hypothetical protein